jgi:hypothetical protein
MSTPNITQQNLRISKEEATRILDRLDAQEKKTEVSARRSARCRLRGELLVATVPPSSFPATTYYVRLRNVSRHGVAFLSRTAMTPGTLLTIHLPIGPESTIVERRATVRRCRHIEGMIHEIGAEFGSDSTSYNQVYKRVVW